MKKPPSFASRTRVPEEKRIPLSALRRLLSEAAEYRDAGGTFETFWRDRVYQRPERCQWIRHEVWLAVGRVFGARVRP